MDDRWWIERGRVGCDEAVGDGKSERCLTLVELELDTCWDRHPCSSAYPWRAHDNITCSEAQESTSSCFLTHSIHDTARYHERINQYDADLVNERGSMSSSSQASAWQHFKSTRCRFSAMVLKGNTKRHGSCLQNQILGDIQCSQNVWYTDWQPV